MEDKEKAEPRGEASLPKPRRGATPDRRSRGTMRQFVREFLSLFGRRTRAELKEIVFGRPEFRRKLQRNPHYFTHLLWDLRQRGEIEQRDGRLVAAEATRWAVLVRKVRFEVNREGLLATSNVTDEGRPNPGKGPSRSEPSRARSRTVPGASPTR